MQLFNKYKLRIPIIILFIMYLIGLIIGNGFKIEFIAILGNICLILCVCFVFFEKTKLRVPIIIFIPIYLIGQIAAYGLNIDFLKVYKSIDNGNGARYSIAATVFPLILAFTISYLYQIFNKKNKV